MQTGSQLVLRGMEQAASFGALFIPVIASTSANNLRSAAIQKLTVRAEPSHAHDLSLHSA